MNAKVHPLIAAIVIVATLACIGVWAWGDGQAKAIGGPAELLVSPSGHLFVQMQNVLLEHDTNGQFVRRHDLSALGVERMLGALAFFPNGDLLLRRGADERSLLDNVRAYLRLPNRKPAIATSPGSGLYRCRLDSAKCRPFGAGRVDFNAAFSVFIEPSGDAVYFSDTTRHLLRKYSGEGEHLADSKSGYKFPNELLVREGRLYVANTNHHQVRIVSPETDTFGREIAAVNVVPGTASRNRQVWPSHVARVGDDWWINNMRSGMNEGGIYIFDDNWQFKRRVDLPEGADPIELLLFNGEVLVSDWNNDRVHRVLVDGVRAGDFDSPGLEALVTESVERRWQYQATAYFALIALGLIIAALLVKALLTESPTEEVTQASQAEAGIIEERFWIEPDAKVASKLRLMAWAAIAMLLGIVPLLAYLVSVTDSELAMIEMLVPVAILTAIILPVMWASLHATRSAIGIDGTTVTLRDHAGNETRVPVDKVSFTGAAIAGGGAAVFLGRQQLALYDRELLESQVFPRLAGAQAVSPWQMQKLLIGMRHPQGVATVAVFIGVAVGAIAYAVLELI